MREFIKKYHQCGCPKEFVRKVLLLAIFLSACTKSAGLVYEGIKIHGLVMKIGLLCDVFVGSSLLHFYGVYVWFLVLGVFLEEKPKKNVVSWSSLMVGYSDNNGDQPEVVHFYKDTAPGP